MAIFDLKIKTNGAAFHEGGDDGVYEVARLLREAADRVEGGWNTGGLMDYNGNTVGSFDWEDRP